MAKFVIQEHQASHHHFDFRLEVNRKLKSWAVPKGPSTNPAEKRLAIETEDHKLSYGDFEGIIPEGEYGAGTVLLWDRGTYENLRSISMPKSYDEGRIEVFLKGKKLKGGYVLVKMKGQERQWLLIKKDDEEADARRNPVKSEPKSVKSGKTLKEIK